MAKARKSKSPENPPDDVAKKLALPRARGRAFIHEELTSGGIAIPGKEAENILKYGYPDIRTQYIEGPGDLTMPALCKIWGIPLRTAMDWKKEWEPERIQRLEQMPENHGGNRRDDLLTRLREEFLTEERATIQMAWDELKLRIKQPTEQVPTAVGTEVIKKRAESFRTELASLKMLIEMHRLNVGLPTKGAANLAINVDARSIQIIEERRPSEAQTGAYLMETTRELLPPDEMAEFETELALMEGEVTESEEQDDE